VKVPHGRAAADTKKKKARQLPAEPWKFWERMPERPVRYAAIASISQVRKAQLVLQTMQLTLISY
jgi:hypothetical protein